MIAKRDELLDVAEWLNRRADSFRDNAWMDFSRERVALRQASLALDQEQQSLIRKAPAPQPSEPHPVEALCEIAARHGDIEVRQLVEAARAWLKENR